MIFVPPLNAESETFVIVSSLGVYEPDSAIHAPVPCEATGALKVAPLSVTNSAATRASTPAARAALVIRSASSVGTRKPPPETPLERTRCSRR